MNDREQFEAAYNMHILDIDENGEYEKKYVKHAWDGWQACAESKQSELDKANVQIEQLLTQLPEGMKHCTIVFKECELGHGRLSATNWVQHECHACNLDKANARIAQLEEAVFKLATLGNGGRFGNSIGNCIARDALIESTDTWLSEHDKAVEVMVLEEIVLSSKLWTDYSDVVLKMLESRK